MLRITSLETLLTATIYTDSIPIMGFHRMDSLLAIRNAYLKKNSWSAFSEELSLILTSSKIIYW